jgi:2-dehydro-3-deoxygalactonokinase
VILSGMAGSTIGWHEAPYLECPVTAQSIIESRTQFSAGGLEFSIVGGLKVVNPLAAPDLMRGEELQLLGWMFSQDARGAAEQLVVLPGTHNKWALVKQGRVETFITALTGELFHLLQNHSVLIASSEDRGFSADEFIRGVTASQALGSGQLLHALFSTRSRQVLGELPERDASSYLSGLLVGSDVVGATVLFRERIPGDAAVTLIGETALSHCYQLALQHLGITVELCDAAQIAIAGYEAIYTNLYTDS